MRTRALIVICGLLLAVGASETAAAQQRKQRKLGAAVSPIRLVPSGDQTLAVSGLQDYFGAIELRAASDGLVVVNRLPLETYLLGLAEVPTDWPEEALRAQAIAARTYALYTLAQPAGGAAAAYGFDICASVQCQVFAGAEIVESEGGQRWRGAVESTAGRAVLYDGAPILARYHSTSGGRTLDNPQAFPDESSYPYLQGVESKTEEASPLYRWTALFRLRELQAILERSGDWPPAARLVEVRTVDSHEGLHYPDVVIKGESRRGNEAVRVRMTAEELRTIVRTLAPEMFPGRFPSVAPTTSGRLPETFPSNRFEISTRGPIVRVRGRGWGHGVGMSQWGAHGMALEGATHPEILGHYYRGTSVGEAPADGRIDVGVAWGRSEMAVTGAFELIDGRGRTLVEEALGTWRFSWEGSGVVSLDPPKGFGLPLRVGIVDAPVEVGVGEPAFLTVALSRPAKVRALTEADDTFEDSGARVRNAGRQRIPWLAPVEPGRYRVRVEAATGSQAKRSGVVVIEVSEHDEAPAPGTPDADDPPAASDRPPAEDGSPWPLIGAVSFLVAVGVIAVTGTMRR